jgi:predicted metal-dependent peptidase
MSELKKTPIKVGNKNGMLIHDKLCSDGPVDENGKPMIDPKTGEPYPGPNDDMADLMHEYLVKIRSLVNASGSFSKTVPRFGVLSLIAMNTPIYVYDHPAFKKVTNTAFTDGIHVFVDADFMRKLVIQEEESDGRESGVIWMLLHELMHKLYYHVDRLKNFPPRIANIAEDMVINGKLIKGFNMIKPVKMMYEVGVGMKPEEADKYYSMAEEVVAEQLLIQDRKNKQKKEDGNQKKKKNGSGDQSEQQNGSGQGQDSGQEDGQDQDGGSEPSGQKGKGQKNKKDSGGAGEPDGQEKKSGKGGTGEKDENGEEYSPIHHITPEELLDIIEENQLSGTVGKALGLPQKDDADGIGKMKTRAKLNDIDAVQTAISQAKSCNGQYPGQHIAESAAELIGDLDKGKIMWKLAIKKHIMGDGQRLSHTDDEANITWYLEKGTMGVDPWYSGSLIPHAPDETVLVLVDTSGSTSGGNMRKEFLQECLSLKRGLSGASDCARKVILLSADTVLRGEPIEITDANVEKLRNEGVPIFGNGGTDFKRCLDEALALPVMKKEKIKTVIYFTDCCDSPPSESDFEVHLNKGVKIVFVTTPGMWNETWNNSISGWSEVYCIEEGTEVNLDKNEISKDTRRNNRMR